MSRGSPSPGVLLLLASLLLAPAARTSAPDQLPSPDDYPAPGSRCRIKKKVYAHVSSRAVVFGKTAECTLQVYSCKAEPRVYRSGARPTRQDVCEDYYATAAALNGRSICCDKAEPDGEGAAEGQTQPGGAAPPPGGSTSDGEKGGRGPALQADLAASIEAPRQYPLGITPFAVTVLNKGPDPAAAVRLTGSIGLGRLNSATTSQGKCSVEGGHFSCELGTVSTHQTRSVSLQARTEREGRAAIGADVRSGTPDPITQNNHAEAAIDVKKATKGTLFPGSHRITTGT